MLKHVGLALAALLLLARPALAYPPHHVAPLTGVNVNFGVDTGAGWGGSDLTSGLPITTFSISSTTCGGGLTTDFKIDANTSLVVPVDSANVYTPPTAVSGSYTVANDFGKRSAINAHGSSNCTYAFTATANGTIPVSGTITVLPNRSDIRNDSFDTAAINQLDLLLVQTGAPSAAHQTITMPETVSGRTSISPATTQNTEWQITLPTTVWNGSGGVTVTSEVPNLGTDANGLAIDGGGFVMGGAKIRATTNLTSYPLTFLYLGMYNNFAGVLTFGNNQASIISTLNNPYGLSFLHNRPATGPAVTNPQAVGGIVYSFADTAVSGAATLNNNHSVNVSPGVACLSARTPTAQAGWQPPQCTVNSNIIETPFGDGIDVVGTGGAVANDNFVFGFVITGGQHPDCIQLEATAFGSGLLTNVGPITDRNVCARANNGPGTGIAAVQINNGGTVSSGATCRFGCIIVPTTQTGSGQYAGLTVTTSNASPGTVVSISSQTGASGTQGGVNYQVGDTFTVDGCCGGLSGTAFTVTQAGQGRQAAQGIFWNNSVAGGADHTVGGEALNNISITDYANNISWGGNGIADSPTIARNLALQDIEADTSGNVFGAAPSNISVNSGTAANLDLNLTNGLFTAANALGSVSQAGPLSCYPSACARATGASWAAGVATYTLDTDTTPVLSPGSLVSFHAVSPFGYDVTNATVLTVNATTLTVAISGNPGSYVGGGSLQGVGSQAVTPSLAAYQAYMPLFSTAAITHYNRGAYILATAPLLNGPAKNPNGTYSSPLFPPDVNNVISFNDGTVFNFNATHTPAMNVPASANDDGPMNYRTAS